MKVQLIICAILLIAVCNLVNFSFAKRIETSQIVDVVIFDCKNKSDTPEGIRVCDDNEMDQKIELRNKVDYIGPIWNFSRLEIIDDPYK